MKQEDKKKEYDAIDHDDNHDRLHQQIERIVDGFLWICLIMLILMISFFGYVHSLSINKINPILHSSQILSNTYCDYTIHIAEVYAQKHDGWTTKRHKNYPTTDIPLYLLQTMNNTLPIDDSMPIQSENVYNAYTLVKFINETIEHKIFPLIRSQFDFLSDDQILIKDLFIVKYNAEDDESQRHLDIHIDSSTVSFNIALNQFQETEGEETDLQTIQQTTFIGGGTRFLLSPKIITNSKGSLMMHPSRLYHEGVPILSGKRYILVGFISAVPRNYWIRNYIRHYGRFSQCMNITTVDTMGQQILEQEPLICKSLGYAYLYELYHIYQLYLFAPKQQGFVRYVNQSGMIALTLAFIIGTMAVSMIAWEYSRWILFPYVWRILFGSTKKEE